MLTIFTIPKPFYDNHISIIQRNAIKSWMLLRPACEIILIGNDKGVAGAAKEFNLKHIPNVACNKFGIPLLNSAFDIAREESKNHLLAFINTDIILLSDFLEIFKYSPNKNFLVVGQRWDLDIKNLINYNNPNWEELLREEVKNKGKLHPSSGSDYFIFGKESFKDLPAFAVGRVGWDNWMIYEARRKKMATIDATELTTVIHQSHDYAHQYNKGEYKDTSPEAKQNMELTKDRKHIFLLEDTNLKLTKNGLRKKKITWHLFKKYLKNTPEILPGNKLFWQVLYSLVAVPYQFLRFLRK